VLTLNRNYVLINQVGLHARPASIFVQTAARFNASIQVTCNGRQADARRILQVLQLGARKGDVLQIRAEGDDAEAALQALGEIIANRFGEAE
jgi:phosphotransferase system HPr (HPr) family protein